MRNNIQLFDALHRKVLVTRESARSLESQIKGSEVRDGVLDVVLDFAGIEAVTPSFVDEILGVIIETSEPNGATSPGVRVTFTHPPTQLSSKFLAIARARGVTLEEIDGAWLIARN